MTEIQARLIKMLFLFDDMARHSAEGVELSLNYCPEEKAMVTQLYNNECAGVELSTAKGTGKPCIRFHGLTDRGRQAYGGFATMNCNLRTNQKTTKEEENHE